jgi:acetyl-CoA acetyltransferase
VKQNALIAGAGMTAFGKHLNRTLSNLAEEAVQAAVKDSGIALNRIQSAYIGAVGAPLITGQSCIAGQVAMRRLGVGRIPIVNVENACATGSTAFQQACTMVSLGACDVALALGMEKMYHTNKQKTLAVIQGGADVDAVGELATFLEEPGFEANLKDNRSLFMRIYARWAHQYMAKSGATVQDFAKVSVKSAWYASRNPEAYLREVLDEAAVLHSPLIAAPLTRFMCSPFADGAAALIVVSPKAARELGVREPIRVLGSLIVSGFDIGENEAGASELAARELYATTGISPQDLDCVELHDASAPAELILYEELGLCAAGEGPQLIRRGDTGFGGRTPVNTSGGLLRKGHPLAATGIAQLRELTLQLRSRASERQVPRARLALAHNGGGFIRGDVAAAVLTVLARPARYARKKARPSERPVPSAVH